MDKARIIHMDNLRILRKQKFNELGFPDRLHPEIEKGLLSDETKNKLKALRDIPQTFDLSKAKTINELKVLIPEILLNNSK